MCVKSDYMEIVEDDVIVRILFDLKIDIEIKDKNDECTAPRGEER